MAVTVQNGGNFTQDPGQRPGLYVRFIEAALAAIGVGSRSKVGTVKLMANVTGSAVTDKVYRITGMEQANELFGAENTEDIELLIRGGASEVVVATFTSVDPSTDDFTTAFYMLEGYEFHVYVNPASAPAEMKTASHAWLQEAKGNGKNFVGVFADSVDTDAATVATDSAQFQDEYAVYVGNGVVDFEDTNVPADLYAFYVAGAIAGASLNESITFKDVPFADVITRFRNADVKEMLAAGVIVTTVDGGQPRVEQGLTLGDVGSNEFNKIRTVRAKQAMIDDINRTVAENYIGNITNNEDGQIAVANAIKTYLETLAGQDIIESDFSVAIDAEKSVGSDLHITLQVKFLDSVEYVYLTVSL